MSENVDHWVWIGGELERAELDVLARAAGLIAVTEVDDLCQVADTIVIKTTVLGLDIPAGSVLFTGSLAAAREWLLARLEAAA